MLEMWTLYTYISVGPAKMMFRLAFWKIDRHLLERLFKYVLLILKGGREDLSVTNNLLYFSYYQLYYLCYE